jgi:cytochrome c
MWWGVTRAFLPLRQDEPKEPRMRIPWVGLLLVLAAPASAQQLRGNAAAGHDLALAVCANCHLVQEGQRKPAMDSVPSFEAVAHDPKMTDERLHGFLNRPHPPMPNIELSRQQIEDVVAYLETVRAAPGRRP